MSTPNDGAKRRLPQQPSEEHLKKQAKRRARVDSLQLAEAQHLVAREYGFASWPKLVAYVESVRKSSGAWHSDPNDNLPKAANAGDVAKVKAMLAAGQFTQHDLDQALGRIVCNMGEYSQADRWIIADLLIDAGADPDGEYGGNYGPIIFGACEGINLDGIQYLLDHGADIGFGPIDTKYGKQTPMGHLLGTYVRGRNENKHKIIDLILAKGGLVPAEVTPEVFAIHRGDAKLLGEMIDKDRSLIRKTFRDMPYGNIALAGATLLHCAIEFGEIECIDAILSRYRNWGDLDMNFKAEVIDGIGGQTPIYHAINTNGDGCFYALEYVIKRNGQYTDMGVKATWRAYGQPQTEPLTPLEYALKAEREMDPKWAHYKPRVKDEIALLVPLDRQAAIRKACAAGDITTVTKMLDEHPELLGPQLWPATIFQAKSFELTKLLLDRGVDPNLCSAPRKPLHLAADRGLIDVVRMLLERGARLDVVDGENITPYELTCCNLANHPGIEDIREVMRQAGASDNVFTHIYLKHDDEAVTMLAADPSLLTAKGPVWFSPLATASRAARPMVVKKLLEMGAAIDAQNDRDNTPLWFACQSSADAADRIAVAKLLLDAGANPRRECEDKSTPLHFAAWRGPIEMVELLLRHNAKEWLRDEDGKLPIDYARDNGVAADREQIIELLDRPVIRDPNFRAAVKAIHTGDLAALKQLLADHPNLVHDRAVEPDCYRQGYFKDPKLLWFIADNPNLIETMPPNTPALAEAIIAAGAEPEDISYTLGLVMTSTPVRTANLLRQLVKLLLDHGAKVTDDSIYSTLGHRERDAIAILLESGLTMTAAIAAGMGDLKSLAALLSTATSDQTQAAFSMAVINNELDAARLCLEAGADPKQRSLVHVHATAAHQAALHDNVPLLELLVNHGAKLDVKDTLWGGTPLGWAIHEKKAAAEAYLRSINAP